MPDPRSPARQEQGWSELWAPVALGAGALLVVVSIPVVLIASIGGIGDCAGPGCDALDATWEAVGRTQGLLVWGWPAAALVLGVLAGRWRALWIVFTAVTALVLILGVIVQLTGPWSLSPQVAGVSLPPIAPGFWIWSPAALCLTIGGALAWRAGSSR